MKLRSPRVFFVMSLLSLAALAASPLSLNDETENYRQLQEMPLERRAALLGNLERFDKLDSAERAKIRKLNAEIATRDPIEQLKYRSLMRRYQLWVSGLTEEQKEALRAADDPQTRFDLALKFRKDELAGGVNSQRIHEIRSGYYGLMPPFEAALLLRIWKKMDTNQKFQVEHGTVRFDKAIRDFNKHLLVKAPSLAPEPQKLFDAQIALIEGNEEFKKLIGLDRMKSEIEKTRLKLGLAEFLYLEKHKPKPVTQDRLEKFSAFCPAWFQAMIDPLSASDARNYLVIVYRQIFPEPLEITAEWKPTKDKAGITSGSPRPAPKRSGTPGPL